MKIVLTGANGFIGRNLKEFLSAKHEILPLSHTEIDLTDGSAVFDYLKKTQPDAVIHAAAKPGHRKATDRENLTFINLAMFVALSEGAKRAGVKKFLHFGSGSEFDMISRPLDFVTEADFGEKIPHDETGFPRYVETRLLRESGYGYNLRCFGVYGKYEDYTMRFISNAVAKALYDLPIEIREDKAFSYLDVFDLCRLAEEFLTKDLPAGDYNAAPPFVLTMREIAKEIVQKTRSSSPVIVLGTGNNYTAGTNKLQSALPEFAFTPFSHSLDELIRYYRGILPEIDPKSL